MWNIICPHDMNIWEVMLCTNLPELNDLSKYISPYFWVNSGYNFCISPGEVNSVLAQSPGFTVSNAQLACCQADYLLKLNGSTPSSFL